MNNKLISLLVFFLWNASFHIIPSFLAAGQSFEQLSPEGGINRILVSESPTGVAVDPITNKIYVANSDDETVSVIDGKTNNVIKTIPVGLVPIGIAVNSITNTIYVANSESHTVSVIDGRINQVVSGITFNVNPPGSGQIRCNDDEIPTNQYRQIPIDTECIAEANTGFQFSNWIENVEKNSIKTISKSTVSDSWTYLLNKIGLLKHNSTFKVSDSGYFTANFREETPPFPPEYLLAIFGFILSVLIPSIMRWFNGYLQRKRLRQYQSKIERWTKQHQRKHEIKDLANEPQENLEDIQNHISYAYTKGKISDSHYDFLQKMISSAKTEI